MAKGDDHGLGYYLLRNCKHYEKPRQILLLFDFGNFPFDFSQLKKYCKIKRLVYRGELHELLFG